jgi:hypothetical protein
MADAAPRPGFLEAREKFHTRFIEPNYEEVDPIFAKANREFFADINDKVLDHIKTMVVKLGGDLDHPKDAHVVSTRHTCALRALDDAKDNTAKMILAWAYNSRKRTRE